MTIFLPLFEVSSYVGVSLNRPHEPLPPEAGPVVRRTFCKGALIERYRVRRKKLGLNSEGMVKSPQQAWDVKVLKSCPQRR